tara:strand:+ start:531 stop:1115 length:585 start_codon:yes stop_codon:yes gene_type:complete
MNEKEKKNRLINKAFRLISKDGWQTFTLKRFAENEKIPLTEIKKTFASKKSLLNEFSRMIDCKVESKIDLGDFKLTSVKDNLFEMIMLRFDEMGRYKVPLRKIIYGSKENPLIFKRIFKNVINSLDFYLELSNAYNNSPVDLVKKNILFLIYSYCFKVWLEDDSKELSKTMVELDKLLSMAESLSKKVNSLLPF